MKRYPDAVSVSAVLMLFFACATTGEVKERIPSPEGSAMQGDQPGPGPEDVLDHFLCYSVEPKYNEAPPVLLWDQFNEKEKIPKELTVGTRAFFCNPVDKKTVGKKPPHETKRQHPDTHLTCYYLQPQDKVHHPVTISNQVTDWKPVRFDPERPYVLCVPTGKAKKDAHEAPPIPKDIDHFKCYYQRTTAKHQLTVDLDDQFRLPQRRFAVLEQQLLCNPASKVRLNIPTKPKEGTRPDEKKPPEPPPPLHPTAHLVCYRLDPQRKVAQTVRIANQFERNALLTTTHATMLCVPSDKSP